MQSTILSKVKGVLEIQNTAQEKSNDNLVSSQVSLGAKLKNQISRLTVELENISNNLKNYGTQAITKWNSSNIDNIKSTRLYSEDASALISIKTVNKVDQKIISLCKTLMPETIYNSIFEEKMTRSIKQEFQEKLISLLQDSLGKDFVEPFLNETTTISLKDQDALNAFLINSDIDVKVRNKVKEAVKLTETSITYSK